VPYWVDFINDKSVVRTRVDADIDRLMAEAGLSFWLTREYELAARGQARPSASMGSTAPTG
jgi:hypothetical protein